VLDALIQMVWGMVGGRRRDARFRDKMEQSDRPWRARSLAFREVVVPMPFDETEALCRRVLAGLGEERPTAAINALSVVTPRSRRSTGTVVQVQLAVASGGTRVEIAAWPGAQLFDWGVSRRLVQEVVDGLGRTLPGSSASRV